MKKLYTLIVFAVFHFLNTLGQVSGDFRSKNSGSGVGNNNNPCEIYVGTSSTDAVNGWSNKLRFVDTEFDISKRKCKSNTQGGTFSSIGGALAKVVGETSIVSTIPVDFSSIANDVFFRVETTTTIASGRYAIGPAAFYEGYTGTFPKLSNAISAITSTPITGNLIFEFQPDYNPTTETYPINISANIASSSVATITFRPAVNVNTIINFATSGTVLNNNGGDYIIFDGRNGGTGTNQFLQFTNTATSNAQATVTLSKDPLYNQFLFCIFKGSTTTSGNGILTISAPTTGNNFYTIDHCNFNANNTANNCLYTSGIATDATITNNNFFDYRDGAGIYLANGSNNAKINNNSFYQTTSIAGFQGTSFGIFVVGGSNVTISNNNIGGSGSGLTGTWKVSSTGIYVYNFTGIFAISLTTTSKIFNNKIQNFDWKTNPSTWTGINVSGLVNVGTDGPNYIGNDTGNNNIKITYNLTGKPQINGIIAGGAAIIENNVIGSITSLLSGVTDTGASFTGIYSTGTGSINHNTIGSSTIPNSINTASQSTGTANPQNVYGIYSTGASTSITNNKIVNITNGSTATNGTTRGILVLNADSKDIYTISSNDIHSVTTSQQVVDNGVSASLDGINIQTKAGSFVTVSGNLIYDLINTSTSAAVCINGIFFYSSSRITSNRIDKNFIHSFITVSNSAVQNGINLNYGSATVQNNVVRLGIDKNGSSIISTAQLNGIMKSSGSPNNLYFNTVYIGGSGVNAGTINTYALNFSWKTGAPEDVRNNIFENMRMNAVPGKLNYAILLPALGLYPLISDYNIYHVSPTDGKLCVAGGIDRLNLKALQEVYTDLDKHSGFGDPLLAHPDDALATMDLRPGINSPAEGTGIEISGISDDFANSDRTSNTPTDIGAFSGMNVPPTFDQDIFTPAITYYLLGNASSTTIRSTNKFAIITDNVSGINVTSGTKPRLYYKINSNNNVFIGNTSSDNGWKWVESKNSTSPFDFDIDYSKLYGGPVVLTTKIQYFIVAQDNAANPYVSFNPSIGASGNSVAPDGMTAPSVPNSYTIVPSLPTVINVGTGQTYTNLTGSGGAFAAINSGTLSANTVINIKSDITEPGLVTLKEFSEDGPNAGSLTLTIQSDGLARTISATALPTLFPLISLDGAKRVIIEGGTGKLLTFRNTNTTPSFTGAVIYCNNSSQNILLTNCILESNSISNTYSVIKIGSLGINNVTITNNDIRDARGGATGSPSIGIYSSSSKNLLNISNNNIYNQKNADSYGMYLLSIDDGCSITGNSIYIENGTTAVGPFTGIFVGSSGSHLISGNYIGGSAKKCGGSFPFTISGSCNFMGIYTVYTTYPAATIQGNTIQNINMTNTTSPVFNGIINESGPIIISSNTIGNSNTINSIQINGTGTSSAISQNFADNQNVNTIEKNSIANISLTSSTGIPTFIAIKIAGGTIRMNNIFNIGSTLSALTPKIYGIYNTNGVLLNEFSNNSISLNGGKATNASLYGFFEGSITGTTGFYYNSINIYGTASGATSSYAFYRSLSADYDLRNNIITNSRTGGTGVHYALYSVSNRTLTSNFNDLYVAGTTIGHWGAIDGSNDVSLFSDWENITLQDANSMSIDPLFNSMSDLKPLTNSPVNGTGKPISVTTDVTGKIRNSIAPTPGAYELDCIGPTNGGIITGDQAIWNSSQPELITNTSLASGHSGLLEYKWLSSVSPFTLWTDIANSNSSTFQSGTIVQTTKFKRLSHTTCMIDWNGASESNIVTLTFNINKWKGTISTNWNDPLNWTQNLVPVSDANIVFDDAPLNDCFMDQNHSVNDITINQSSYHLNANGKMLTIKGNLNLTNGAQIDAIITNSTLIFSGDSTQTIPSASLVNDKIYNLTIDNSNNVVLNGSFNLLNSITALSGRLDASTNAPSVIFGGMGAQDINSSVFINNKVHNLIIDNPVGASLVSDLTVHQLLTINSGKQLVIPTEKILNVEGTINNYGGTSGIILKTSPTGSAPNGSLIFHNPETEGVPVPATVEMYTKAAKSTGLYRWQYFGIPLKSIQANPTFSGSYVREMHEAVSGTLNHWEQLQNESVLTSFIGYEITQLEDKTITFKGILENADYGPHQLTFTPEATYKGQHLIGNPYTAAINIKNIATPENSLVFGNGMNKTVYLYNTGSYDDWSMNGLNGSGNSDSAGQYLAVPQENAGIDLLPASIPSMQAFLVVINSPGSEATLSIPYSAVGTIIKNTTLQRATNAEKVFTRIDINSSCSSDRMWIFTDPSCTRGFDNGWDGYKILGSTTAPQIYAMEKDGYYQVNSIDDINNTLLGFRAGSDTDYTLTFKHQNKDVRYNFLYLMDLFENKTVEITTTGSQYSFTHSEDAPENRFKIIALFDGIDFTTEDNSNLSGSDLLKVFSSKNTILVHNQSKRNGDLYLYDLTGRVIQKLPFIAKGITTLPVQLPEGSYLAKAVTVAEQVTAKIILRD